MLAQRALLSLAPSLCIILVWGDLILPCPHAFLLPPDFVLMSSILSFHFKKNFILNDSGTCEHAVPFCLF